MKILKMLFAIAAFSCISTLSFADIHLHNSTGYWLSVRIPYWVFIGVKNELNFDVAPGEDHNETKDLACVKEDVYIKAFREAPENRPAGIGPVAEVTFGKNFGGSLADVNVFTAIDAAGKEILKVAVEAR